jgi:DtxR family Mn-dependent transcriptional regulator
VRRVAHQSAEMLELLQHKNIGIGTRLEVKKHFDFDHSVEIRIKTNTITISEQLAKNIFVTYEL